MSLSKMTSPFQILCNCQYFVMCHITSMQNLSHSITRREVRRRGQKYPLVIRSPQKPSRLNRVNVLGLFSDHSTISVTQALISAMISFYFVH